MNSQTIKFHGLILLSILTVLTSCNGQNTSHIADNSSTITGGDTVSATHDSILVIFQDKNNNYWFGSNGHGVYLYRGKTIIRFTTKNGLCDNRIWEIQEDKAGNIYLTTSAGISKFNGQTFTTLPVIESNDWKLQSDDLWFKGDKGPYRYDGKLLYHLKFPKHSMEDEYYRIFPNMPWSPYDIYTIYKDRKDHVWFGTSNFGLCRFDGKSLSWMYEEHLTLVAGGGSFGIRSIIEDKEGKFWVCNTSYRYNILPGSSIRQGNNLIDYKREKGIDNFKTPDGKDLIYFMSAIKDDNGAMWLATYDQGVWQYDGKTITHYPVKDGSNEITLFSIYKDKQGHLCLGTHQAGAYKFNGKTFEKFKP